MRFVVRLNPRSHIGTHEFKSLETSPVSSRVVQIILNLFFIINSCTSADYMIEPFVSTSLVHSYVRMFRGNNILLFPK